MSFQTVEGTPTVIPDRRGYPLPSFQTDEVASGIHASCGGHLDPRDLRCKLWDDAFVKLHKAWDDALTKLHKACDDALTKLRKAGDDIFL